MKTNWSALTYYENLDRVRLHISCHFCEPLSLETLAGIAGTEAKHLSGFFHRKTGMKLMVYLGLVRLRAAVALMQRSNRNLLTIAMDVGFGSLRTFERTFQRYLGRSPNVFRSAVTHASLRPQAQIATLIPHHLKAFFSGTLEIPRKRTVWAV